MLEHGGHLIDATKKYNIPLNQWTDLSTGINPNGWPIPAIPARCWQRLPESSDDLISAAKNYYQCQSILAVAGSQAAIQVLPLLRSHSTVGVLSPAYAEHGYNWKKKGHKVIELDIEAIDSQIDKIDVLIIINPNNPTAQQFSKEQLLTWHKQLSQHNGWLIVDEAFIDSTAENSLSSQTTKKGLIILRSIGKFFGLAGIRSGFVIADEAILNALNAKLGPWAISHPSRYIASLALQDSHWQKQTRKTLKKQAEQLSQVLTNNALQADGKSDLFQWVKTIDAKNIHHFLAQHGILTRLFTAPLSLRFGLAKNEQQRIHLDKVLKAYRSVS
ncbi:MAG: threonine-phosphate decarboxylase [Methylococcales symbiont of Iophon sp. n. MRB-2018]|nr:MAG: threonine-phosphate decarboxylase [Methylococcales symbiont of Iophon sp. n. MRB-2018]KAF3978902.1 MAG: threonine-phosphate decarboxylase [Methylococcales symbiont of Iophon sp. n. MRB-2018]